MFSKSLFVTLAAVAIAVNAQSSASPAPTSPSGGSVPSVCILECSMGAAKYNGCVTATNLTCACQNQQFQADVRGCVQNRCPNEVDNAAALQQTYCPGSPSVSVTNTPRTDFYSLLSTSGSSKPTGSSTPSTNPNTGTSLEAGVIGSFFGAVLAAVFAL